MKNGDIFKKTMPFVWGRFGMQLALNLGLIIYSALVIWLLISLIESNATIAIIIGLAALGIGIKLYSFGCEYISYMIKAAHIAVIGEIAINGQLPQGVDMKEYGKQKVKERFLTANVFFAIDKLMSAAVRQIQNGISKIGGIFGNSDVVKTITSIINVFVGIVLGYVDEAVLARVFQKKEDGAWKASCDGVVLYFQNWKAILKNALGITVGIIAFYAIGMGALYGIIALISGGTEEGWAILFLIIAFFIIDVIKVAFIDSYVTISVINKYLPLTINQQPALDIYEKGQKWSKKFQDMCNKAKEESQPVVQAAVAGVPGMTMAMPMSGVQQQPAVQQPMMQPQMMPQQPTVQPQAVQQPMMQPQMMPQQPAVQPQAVQQPMMQPQMMPQQPTVQPQVVQQPMMQPQQMAPTQPMMQPQQPIVGQPTAPQMQQQMPGQLPNNNGQSQ